MGNKERHIFKIGRRYLYSPITVIIVIVAALQGLRLLFKEMFPGLPGDFDAKSTVSVSGLFSLCYIAFHYARRRSAVWFWFWPPLTVLLVVFIIPFCLQVLIWGSFPNNRYYAETIWLCLAHLVSFVAIVRANNERYRWWIWLWFGPVFGLSLLRLMQ